MHITLTPYNDSYDEKISKLENSVVQGKGVQLKIIKKHFLDRSAVFLKTFPCLALNEEQGVIGTAIGAETKLMLNGETLNAGFVLDTKVHESYRNNGVGRSLANAQNEWFTQQGWEKNFTTLKSSNLPVIKLSYRALKKFWLTPFVYLTIPTSIFIRPGIFPSATSNFSVRLFDPEKLKGSYFTNFPGGLGVFHTWMMYQLKIENLSWLYRQGMSCVKKLQPMRYSMLPKQDDVIQFATLFNHSEVNINGINEVLQHLNTNGKRFLLVCCRKGDSIYRHLKKYSINLYGYYILSDFPLGINDKLTIDVRCL